MLSANRSACTARYRFKVTGSSTEIVCKRESNSSATSHMRLHDSLSSVPHTIDAERQRYECKCGVLYSSLAMLARHAKSAHIDDINNKANEGNANRPVRAEETPLVIQQLYQQGNKERFRTLSKKSTPNKYKLRLGKRRTTETEKMVLCHRCDKMIAKNRCIFAFHLFTSYNLYCSSEAHAHMHNILNNIRHVVDRRAQRFECTECALSFDAYVKLCAHAKSVHNPARERPQSVLWRQCERCERKISQDK